MPALAGGTVDGTTGGSALGMRVAATGAKSAHAKQTSGTDAMVSSVSVIAALQQTWLPPSASLGRPIGTMLSPCCSRPMMITCDVSSVLGSNVGITSPSVASSAGSGSAKLGKPTALAPNALPTRRSAIVHEPMICRGEMSGGACTVTIATPRAPVRSTIGPWASFTGTPGFWV